jgi:hypothetical protein
VVHAQFPPEPGMGGITGSVTDPSGDGIPDVHISGRSGPERFDALTDCSGHYRISGLEPGITLCSSAHWSSIRKAKRRFLCVLTVPRKWMPNSGRHSLLGPTRPVLAGKVVD